MACCSFDPNNINKKMMEDLANYIEEYLELFLEVMVIPDEIIDECKGDFDEAIMRTRKLIKKLKKGKTSVFNDADEWNSVF